MSLSITKNTNITRVLSAKGEDGKPHPVASLTGQVIPGKGMTFSFVINDMEQAANNQDDVVEALDAFSAELRTMARENGLPI